MMDQKEACEYLRKKHGIAYKPSTLQTKRYTGDGPVFYRIKRKPMYTPEALDTYAEKRTKTAFSSTAEENAARADNAA